MVNSVDDQSVQTMICLVLCNSSGHARDQSIQTTICLVLCNSSGHTRVERQNNCHMVSVASSTRLLSTIINDPSQAVNEMKLLLRLVQNQFSASQSLIIQKKKNLFTVVVIIIITECFDTVPVI